VNISAFRSFASEQREIDDGHQSAPNRTIRASAWSRFDAQCAGRYPYLQGQGAETGGSFSLWEAVVPPGAGPPPYTHAREDEAIYVLSGELLFELEGEPAPHRVGPGAFVFGGRRRRHGFRNVGDQPARILILSAPSCGLDQDVR
jgi:quercetin dioxygenase-like cupin family protein